MRTVDAREEEERFIKWVPLVVPMFALVLVVLVYFIGAEVM